MKNTSIFSYFTITVVILFITSCSTDSGSGFTLPEPTFDNVEEKTFDINGIEAEPVQDGTIKYIVEEGFGEDRVVIRDGLHVFLTLRNIDGEIIYSTYQNDRTSPDFLIVMNSSLRTSFQTNEIYELPRSLTEGLRKGLIGMKEGEKRVLIVPPEEGFASVPSQDLRAAFRSDTLRYDIELVAIL